MFKGKLWLWVIIIIVCFTAQWLIESIPVWTHTDDVSVGINVETDNDLDSVLSNTTLNKFNISITDDGPDIVISDEQNEIDGYTKYENYLYSPMVAYASAVRDYNDGFIAVPNTDNCYKIDLYSVLIAVENGATWKSIGINEKVAKGTATLYIPNEQSPYYDEVVDLFYLTLNQGKVPTAEEREELTGKVNNILSKCQKVADINQMVYEEYKNPTDEHKILIGPEFLYLRGKDESMGPGKDSRGYTNTKQYRPIYFLDTVTVSADIYIKNDTDKTEILTNFVNAIKSKSDFMDTTGWRIKNYSFGLSNVYYETH